MTIYSKTMVGRMVAFDQSSALTPALKEFLKLVDGKASADQLAARWHQSADASQLLQQLESQGLIEVRAARWSNSTAHSDYASSFVSSFVSSFADSAARKSEFAAQQPTKEPDSSDSSDLAAIKDHMATFVLTHLPHYAMTALKEIEDIKTYDMLTLMLTAYANMTREAGRTGLAHIKSLRAMMEPGFEATAH